MYDFFLSKVEHSSLSVEGGGEDCLRKGIDEDVCIVIVRWE
jgi:hypothetical protein